MVMMRYLCITFSLFSDESDDDDNDDESGDDDDDNLSSCVFYHRL
jgi:hypothetical protein